MESNREDRTDEDKDEQTNKNTCSEQTEVALEQVIIDIEDLLQIEDLDSDLKNLLWHYQRLADKCSSLQYQNNVNALLEMRLSFPDILSNIEKAVLSSVFESGLLITTFEKKCSDTSLISKILTVINDSSYSFTSGIFDLMSLLMLPTEDEPGSKLNENRNMNLFNFIICHASKNNLLFNGRKIYDVVCLEQSFISSGIREGITIGEAAIQLNNPEALQILLQNSCRFSDQTRQNETPYPLIQRVLINLVMDIMQNDDIWDKDKCKLRVPVNQFPKEVKQARNVAEMLFRCVHNPEITVERICEELLTLNEDINIRSLIGLLGELFPYTVSSNQPPRLEHMCRMIIRDNMLHNYSLAEAIKTLQMSKILEDYISLKD